jgi:DNA modification methylase
LIYEPFAGSGTAFIAAEKEGRRCCGLELSSAFVDVIVQRWSKFTGRAAVLADDGRTFDELAEARGVSK